MHVITYFHMADDTHASGQGAVGSYNRASGQTCATCDRGIFADAAVVGNLYLVIDDDAVLYHRVIQGTTINCGTGADLYSIAYTHTAELAYFLPA
jgi:hypothetical protein